MDCWNHGMLFIQYLADRTISKSGIWGCKKKYIYWKIAFTPVQMKSIEIHITNQKLSFDIFTVGYKISPWNMI